MLAAAGDLKVRTRARMAPRRAARGGRAGPDRETFGRRRPLVAHLDDVGESSPNLESKMLIELDRQVIVAAHPELQGLDSGGSGAVDERSGHEGAQPQAPRPRVGHDLG